MRVPEASRADVAAIPQAPLGGQLVLLDQQMVDGERPAATPSTPDVFNGTQRKTLPRLHFILSIATRGIASGPTNPMTHNDLLRSLRYVLDVSDAKLGEIVRLGGGEVSPVEMT